MKKLLTVCSLLLFLLVSDLCAQSKSGSILSNGLDLSSPGLVTKVKLQNRVGYFMEESLLLEIQKTMKIYTDANKNLSLQNGLLSEKIKEIEKVQVPALRKQNERWQLIHSNLKGSLDTRTRERNELRDANSELKVDLNIESKRKRGWRTATIIGIPVSAAAGIITGALLLR